MVQYKGYYIDHVIFNSKAEIDAKIKSDLIKRMQKFNRMAFSQNSISYALSALEESARCARTLHDEYGMDYSEIEALEMA